MEPAKAGNDEEDEMHPVPAKVLSDYTTLFVVRMPFLRAMLFTFADLLTSSLS